MALQVCLPGDFFTAPELLIEAQTVWSLQDEPSGLYATGLQFENLSGENGQIVQEIILALGSRDNA